MKHVRSFRFVAALASAIAVFVVVAKATDDVAVKPVARQDGKWQQLNKIINERAQKGNVDLIFIGDSITSSWAKAKDVWDKYYGKRNAANLGIGGDQTAHVLWWLDHGNIDGISPKLAVVMIGTNNAGHTPHQSPEQVAAGVKAVIQKFQTKLPQTKVLVLAIFPRGTNNNDEIRQINIKANTIISKLADEQNVFFLDIGPKFLDADGTLSEDIMPDLLHLNVKGYRIWAEAIEPSVRKLMGE